MKSLLDIENLSIATRKEGSPLVQDLSLSIAPGETLAVVGESGSGKSLTALSILGLLPKPVRQTAGRIAFNGPEGPADLAQMGEKGFQSIRGRQIGMIFQEPMSAFSQVKTVGDQIGEPLVRHQGLSRRAARARAAELLDELDVPQARDVVARYPFEFSGGMLQRAMIARAVACDPDLIIADEPTTALDVTVQAQVLRLLHRVQQQEGSGMLFITHDLAVAREISDRVAVMQSGRLVEAGPTADILSAPVQPYTQALLAAVPRLNPVPPRDSTGDAILEAKGVSLAYGGTQPLFGRPKPAKPVLDDVSLTLERGSILGLVGESGSGKTTLARAVLGLAQAQAGQIAFHASEGKTHHPRKLGPKSLKLYWRHAQMVFQNPYASLNPWLSVEQTLTEPLLNQKLASPAEAKHRAAETLEACGLDRAALSRFPHSFSGGQRQRIAIARALVTRPDFVVCDEPMSALDVSTQARIAALLLELRDKMGLTLLIITHDLAAASQLCDRIAVMKQGRIVEEGTTEQVFRLPQTDYTRALLAAVPRLDPMKEAI